MPRKAAVKKAQPKEEQLFCPYCDDEIIMADLPYCQSCQITVFYCPSCRKPTQRQNRICPSCGAEIKVKAAK